MAVMESIQKAKSINRRLKRFQKNLQKHVLDSIMQEENQVIDEIVEQLFRGLDQEGNPIDPKYSELTKIIKRSKGQPSDRVTLKDTGDFYASIYLVRQSNGILVKARDRKTKKLLDKYGFDILGLHKKGIEDIAQGVVKQWMIEKFKTIALAI